MRSPGPAAREAIFLVNAEKLAALWTGPSLLFQLSEIPDTGLFYFLQILNHAHGVFCPVTLVQVHEPLTRI